MKNKNKFMIGFWIFAAISVILAIVLVGIIAAYTTKSESDVHITYEAGANVEATITAEWKINDQSYVKIKSEDESQDFIRFNTTDTDVEVTKSFKPLEIEKIGRDDVVMIHYNIKNDSDINSLTLIASVNPTTINNLKIEYSINNIDWETEFDEVVENTTMPDGQPAVKLMRIQ